MVEPLGETLPRIINRLLGLPFGEGIVQDYSNVLREAVKADSSVILLVNSSAGTARILGGTGLHTPVDKWHEQVETPFIAEQVTEFPEVPALEFQGPFTEDPFLVREGVSSLLLKTVSSGEEVLVALLFRREPGVYTAEEVEKFAAVSGVAGTLMLLHNSLKETGFPRGAYDQTGLGHFSDFHKSMVKELSRARRNSRSVTMGIMFINAGDPHLKKDTVVTVARAFQKQLRDFDTLVRYGSSELAFILPELRSAESVRVLERVIRETVSSAGVQDHVENIYIGLSCYPEDGAAFERLIEMAEAAMNKAVEESTPGVFRWTENGDQ